jgi:EAL and modified HD-GYP domain-containing signal transduction protein
MVGCSETPDQVVTTSLIRAKMCELLAQSRGKPGLDRYFTIGILSMVDALLGAPMEEILSELPLADEINAALLQPGSGGDLSQTLGMVKAFERGDWDSVTLDGLTPTQVSNAYHAAVTWSTEASAALAA